jgi:hypothetical protein
MENRQRNGYQRSAFHLALENTLRIEYGSKKLPRFPILSALDGLQKLIRVGAMGYQSATENAMGPATDNSVCFEFIPDSETKRNF